MNAPANVARADPERDWWLRALAVLGSPRPVFAALRDDSDDAADARQEPVLALVMLAGLSGVLTSPTTGNLLDNPERDGLLVAVLLFLSGALYGVATYWIGGGVVYLGARAAGGTASYRRARHVLAFAAAPLALALLVLWPLQLGVYRGDLFRTGGADADSSGRLVFQVLEGGFYAWAAALLVIGVAVVHRWKLVRALGALALAAFALLSLTLAWIILGA